MNYNINNTINDFEKFIEFNESKKPILSAKKGVLCRKDSFELNTFLENKKEVNAPSYNQDQYPVIDLMFTLTLDSKLYIRANDEKGKLKLVKTPNMQKFQSLNEYEKYVFLLQTYWTKYNYEEKFDKWINISALYNIISEIANSEEGQIIVKDENNSSKQVYATGAAFFHHLSFFGFGRLELIEGAKGKYEDSIKSFYPNEFGIKISRFLLSEALSYWNREDLSIFFKVKKIEVIPNKKQQCFDVFKNIFEENLVENTVQRKGEIDRSGVYSFKVSLSKTLWRKISLSHKHTLTDLHNAIQEAFEFDNDHLYAFYIDGNQRTGKVVYCKDAEQHGNTAEDTSIADLELYKGQQMLYLFDFGDQWEFNVELIEFDKQAPVLLKPIIVESKGNAPKQYRSGWY